MLTTNLTLIHRERISVKTGNVCGQKLCETRLILFLVHPEAIDHWQDFVDNVVISNYDRRSGHAESQPDLGYLAALLSLS